MHGKIVQPEVPELLTNLAFGRIAVLIERFQIAEDAGKLLSRNAEFLGVHGFGLCKKTIAIAGDGWRGVQNSSFGRIGSISEFGELVLSKACCYMKAGPWS